MTIPQVRVELRLDDEWTDITSDVRTSEEIEISRGRRDETEQADPGTCTLTLNNRSGTYSPRNPESPYYGQLGRNQPIRVLLGEADARLVLNGSPTSYASMPYDEGADSTIDELDVRVEIEPDSWRPSDNNIMTLASRYQLDDDQRSWALSLTQEGQPHLLWSLDGTFDSAEVASISTAFSRDAGRVVLAATVSADESADETTVRFYTADSIDADWSEWDQLGDDITTGDYRPVYQSDSPVQIGTIASDQQGIAEYSNYAGAAYALRLRHSIDGDSDVAIDFTGAEAGDSEVDDDEAGVWQLNGSARISQPSVRFRGEVTSWPPRWDPSGQDSWITIEASGILRRLQQGKKALRSTLRRGMLGGEVPLPREYWPMEDGEDASSFASAVGNNPMRPFGDVSPADDDVYASSEALPTLDGDGTVSAPSQGFAPTGTLRVSTLMHVPDDGVDNESVLLNFTTAQSGIVRWMLTVSPDGAMTIYGWDGSFTQQLVVDNTADFNGDFEGVPSWTGILLTLDGDGTLRWQIFLYILGGSAPGIYEETADGFTAVGSATNVSVGIAHGGEATNTNLVGTSFGHILVQDQDNFWDMERFLAAWRGESAADRIERLCAEENVPVVIVGDHADTVALGPQGTDTMLDLLTDAAEADMGILGESKELLGLEYRTRRSLYNQRPVLELDYSSGHVSDPFEPVDDDQNVRNDITVERDRGSSHRTTKDSGPLSVQPPPEGVGRYDESYTVNIERDTQLRHQSQWRLHVGTVDELRYPTITVDLTDDRMAPLRTRARNLSVGDRVDITNPPPGGPPDTIRQLVQGYTERIGSHTWTFELTCSPASPWSVGETVESREDGLPDGRHRADTESAELAESIDSESTEFDVTTNRGPVWIDSGDYADAFPFDIRVGGEVMRVTDVSGDSSPQTFTVERSRNGIQKTHENGTPVSLAYPAVVAL